jgi:hypothetical protein
LKLAVHLVIMDLWRWVLTKLSHNSLWGMICPKCIYFPEYFCYCFSSNLCVLNTTNMDWRCFQQNCSGVSFLCRNPTFSKNSGKSSKILFHQKTHGARRRDGEEARGALTYRWRGPALVAPPDTSPTYL